MAGDTTPLMQQLNSQMHYLTQRQAVLSQNIANIDTPGFRSKDLKKPDFNDMAASSMGGKLAMTTTSPKHLTGLGANANGGLVAQEIGNESEVSPTKNNVSLDEEMAKISDTGAEYQLTSSLMHKFVSLQRTAIGNK